jgi:hypothetical protein
MEVKMKTLDINKLNEMPIENIISLYRQGYTINNSSIKSLTACAGITTPIIQGVDRIVTVVVTGGTTPVATMTIDGTNISLTELPVGTFSGHYTFPNTGDRTIVTTITSSCTGQAPVVNTCTVNVTAAQINTWKCTSANSGTCTRDATGTFQDQASCEAHASCMPPPGTKWKCTSPNSGTCMIDTTGVSPHENRSICEAAADCKPSIPKGYNCGACDTLVDNGKYMSPTSCKTGCGTTPTLCGTKACDDTNICIAGQCIPKKYLLYGGIGLAAFMMLKPSK